MKLPSRSRQAHSCPSRAPASAFCPSRHRSPLRLPVTTATGLSLLCSGAPLTGHPLLDPAPSCLLHMPSSSWCVPAPPAASTSPPPPTHPCSHLASRPQLHHRHASITSAPAPESAPATVSAPAPPPPPACTALTFSHGKSLVICNGSPCAASPGREQIFRCLARIPALRSPTGSPSLAPSASFSPATLICAGV